MDEQGLAKDRSTRQLITHNPGCSPMKKCAIIVSDIDMKELSQLVVALKQSGFKDQSREVRHFVKVLAAFGLSACVLVAAAYGLSRGDGWGMLEIGFLGLCGP